MRRVTKRPRKKVRKTRRRRNYRKMRGGEAKRVTVHVHDIIGGDVLFTIEFDYYPEYKVTREYDVKHVYNTLTELIKTKFEDYLKPGMVYGGANPPKSKITLDDVIKNKDKILADIEIFANNPSIMAIGETNTLPDRTTVKYKGLYEQIPKFIKENTINKDIIDLKTAHLNALDNRVKLRQQSQLLAISTQPKIPPLKFDLTYMKNLIHIEPRKIKKGTSKIYNTSGAIIIGENGRIKDDLFEVTNLASKLAPDGPIQMTVYVK